MKLNYKALGASLLSAGPLLVQFGGATTAWWLGVAFTAVGPILLAIQVQEKPKPKRKNENSTAQPRPRGRPRKLHD
jgi:hypothetical protein